MNTYVCLFRGINVGGRRTIRMADLSSLLESIGFAGIETYLQSGNAVFDAKGESETSIASLATKEVVKAFGFDVSAEAVRFCKARNCDGILQAAISEIPFKDECFDVVLSLDVLTCLEKGERETAFSEIGRVIKPGGTLVLNLPAYQWLMSRHDRAVGTRRRYTTGGLRRDLENAGFAVRKMTYRNMFLFPAIAVKRLWDKRSGRDAGSERSDLTAVPGAINALLRTVLIFENRLLSRLDLPFGLSVFCIAEKPS